MRTYVFTLCILAFSSLAGAWTLPEGQLSGEDFNSDTLIGKASVVFYVSPSKKDLNEEASEAVKKEKFNSDNFSSVGIIDLKSSWIPNGLIVRSIKKKQKKYPRTIYLKDKDRHMHEILSFEPKGNDVFVFNAKGEEVYRHLGKLNTTDIDKLVSTLKKEINSLTEN